TSIRRAVFSSSNGRHNNFCAQVKRDSVNGGAPFTAEEIGLVEGHLGAVGWLQFAPAGLKTILSSPSVDIDGSLGITLLVMFLS
ncbi:hypothetical protein L195_g047663, partial [Trifolium pratense]